MINCINCKGAIFRATYWIVRWPFNFKYVACPTCGPVDQESGLRLRIENVMLWLFPFDGTLHRERHRWWMFGGVDHDE